MCEGQFNSFELYQPSVPPYCFQTQYEPPSAWNSLPMRLAA